MVKPRSTEHGLLMSGPMALAAFSGIKTQTRRPVKLKGAKPADLELTHHTEGGADFIWTHNPSEESPYVAVKCPFGQVGDRVYVREAWTSAYASGCWGTLFRADGAYVQGKQRHEKGIHYNAEDLPPGVKWRPSLHLPKWASRTWGTIASVRVERVQSIAHYDIRAEGIGCPEHDFPGGFCCSECGSLRGAFASLWDSIYSGELSWTSNPWVWVVQWEREIKGAV